LPILPLFPYTTLFRSKLVGFTWTSGRVLTRYPLADTSLPARYARAISAYRFGQLAPALKQIDALIAEQPGNPYFLELRGQALLEDRKSTRLNSSHVAI